ncbi:hypothetical protein B0J12DRAFT_706345 [Macrophomina phaseolina]|uniref:Carrier domain-containing protein n=1 Tax=Macrophomina phaseolina TaxID=35725 RepID=A0ABQ8FP86_9PEZI|nr:hypothetical protein B0J12DRAFT_706345 [Macrophomina phaseolina]
MIGPTFTTIPMRFTVNGSSTVSELFDSAQSVSINPAQHIGLQRIKQVSSSAQAACDFNSLLVVQPATQEHDDMSDNFFLRENNSELISSFTNYGFVLVCQLLPSGGLDASAVFDSNLISQHQVLRILAQFEHLLQQLCGVEALSVADVDFLSLDDATEVAAYNLLEQPTAESSLCLHHIIEQHAHRQPNSAAISSWDGDFTYGELNSLANKLAGHLVASRKVSSGDTVPLCFEKSKWTLVAMLSVMKAGAAFLLLDPANPVNRLESICNKVKAKVALVSSSLRSLLSHCVREVFVLDQQRAESLTDDLLCIAVDPTDAAYVVTTSGTSGEPKACVIEHRSIVAGAQSFTTSAHLDSKTRAMQFASYSFDASIIETLMVWVAGGCTCILSETDRKDNLAAAIAKLQINWSLMTPSLASLLTPKDIPTMKTVVLGGEAATPELLATWSRSVTLLQAYGPCECTPVACCSPAPLTAASNPRNIGTPLRNVRAWVVLPSNHDKLAPVGSVGELVLEGATVGRGYIDEPDKTAAAFIAAPEWRCQRFSAAPLQRFYKTGDLVRYGDAGELIFVGRKDAQVKVHGQRLELAEIEHQLRRAMARPCDVAVELVASGSGGSGAPILAAFVAVGHACCSEDEAARQALQGVLGDAKSALANALPSYMVPRVFVPVPVLPLNAAGKVDRKALRQMDSKVDEYYGDTEGEVPVTSTGLVLQTLWARVLDAQVGRIHAAASFTDLGGDSLAAMRLASKAREAGISLSVADIMRQPRFADMEAKCRPLTEAAAVPEYKPFSMFPSTGSVEEFLRETLSVNIRDVEDVIEATSMQKAMTAAAMSPTQGTVNHVWLDFHGAIDLYRLKDACSEVFNHHSILRTVFVPHDEKLLQVVFRSHTPEFHLRHANHGVDDATTALINDNKQQPERFGVHGLRFCFIHNDSATASSTDTPTGRLVIRTPHNLYDGISLPQILDDLRTAYANRSALPPSPSFSSHLGSWRHLQRSSGATAFWRQHLSGSRITPITSPHHQPLPSTNPINGHFTRHIPAAALATTPHTFETLLYTAWALVLRHLSKPSANNDDILFARAVANRHLPLPAAASVVGPTLNAVPVRVNLAAHRASPLPRLLAAVADARLAALPHELLETDVLARHCTDWPRGARFGSLVVHNAIPAVEEGGAFGGGRLVEWEGGVQAKLGWSVAPWDAADVQITSTPVGGGGSVRVDMVFSDRVVPARVAERMLVGLCRVVEVLGGVEAGDERRWEDVQVEGEEVLRVEKECCLPLELGSCGLLSSDPVLSSSSASAWAPSSPGSSYEVVSVEGLGESDGERATSLSAV